MAFFALLSSFCGCLSGMGGGGGPSGGGPSQGLGPEESPLGALEGGRGGIDAGQFANLRSEPSEGGNPSQGRDGFIDPQIFGGGAGAGIGFNSGSNPGPEGALGHGSPGSSGFPVAAEDPPSRGARAGTANSGPASNPISGGAGVRTGEVPQAGGQETRIGQNGLMSFSYRLAMREGNRTVYNGCQGTLAAVKKVASEFLCAAVTATHCLNDAYVASAEKGQEAGALVGKATFLASDFGEIQGAKIYLNPNDLKNRPTPNQIARANDGGVIIFPCKGDIQPIPMRDSPLQNEESIKYSHRMLGAGMGTGLARVGRVLGHLFEVAQSGTQTVQGDSGGGVFDRFGNLIGALLGGLNGERVYSDVGWAKQLLQNLGFDLPRPHASYNDLANTQDLRPHRQPAGENPGRHGSDSSDQPI